MSQSPFVIAPRPVVSIPITAEEVRFPVNRIFCVGQNYAEHAREMGGMPEREPPFFFMKSAEALVTDGQAMVYPPLTANLHFEVELVVALSKGGSNIALTDALDHVFGYAVGLDMTRRDMQAEAKATRRPWDLSKNFANAGPLGPITRAASHPAPSDTVTLEVDGVLRQAGTIGDMIWSVPEIIATLSRYQPLVAGDLIYTGTPAGVGPVAIGSEMVARIAGLPALHCAVIGPPGDFESGALCVLEP